MRSEYYKNGEGRKIHYALKKFDNDKPAIVFIHGLGGNGTAWNMIAEKFHKCENSTLIIDMIGHGHSGKPRKQDDYTLDKYLQDLCGLIDHVKLDNIIIVGHSTGGMIASLFYLKYPKQVSKLVLISSTYTSPLKYIWLLSHNSKPFIKGLVKSLSYLFKAQPNKGVYTDYTNYRNSNQFERSCRDLISMPVDIYLYSLLSFLDFDISKDLQKINVPTLMISGDHDWVTKPESSFMMSKRIRDSRVNVIPGTDHAALLQKPDEVFKHIRVFIEEGNFEKSKGPKISVVIPAHNEENYIQACLESIKKQTFKDFEIITVANACSDKTAEIAGQYGQVVNLEEAHISKAKNLGAGHAKGEIVVFIDADSTMSPTLLHSIFKSVNKGCVGGTCRTYPDIRHTKSRLYWNLGHAFQAFYLIPHGLLFARKDVFDNILFKENIRIGEDSKLLRALKTYGKITYLKRAHIITSMRKHEKTGYVRWAYDVTKGFFFEKNHKYDAVR